MVECKWHDKVVSDFSFEKVEQKCQDSVLFEIMNGNELKKPHVDSPISLKKK
jgi:hypothetical protein